MKSRNKRFYGGSQERYLQYMKNSERYCGCSRSPRNEEYKEYNEEYRRILDEMIRKMTGAQLTGNVSLNFIRQMIPHHRAAVQMSENLLKYRGSGPLAKIAENIITEQTNGISELEKAERKCRNSVSSDCVLYRYGKENDIILCDMFSEMTDAVSDGNIECDFIREMVPHHLGAVRMSENALKSGVCRELVPILTSIIRNQKHGIMQMRRMSRRLACRT